MFFKQFTKKLCALPAYVHTVTPTISVFYIGLSFMVLVIFSPNILIKFFIDLYIVHQNVVGKLAYIINTCP